LFLYDNGAFVIESFLDQKVTVHVVVDPAIAEVTDVLTGKVIIGEQRIAPEFMGRKFGKDATVLEMEIPAHSFRAFHYGPLQE
jgi:hypothetical protein